jgi:hypothetical protein
VAPAAIALAITNASASTVAPPTWSITGGYTMAGGVTLAGGAAATTSYQVSVTLGFGAALVTSFSTMSFSQDGGLTWSTPQAFALTSTLTLTPGDGLRTVMVRVTDAGGNEATSSATIRLDTTGPTVTTSVADQTVLDITDTRVFTFAATDVSGVRSTTAVLDGVAVTSGVSLSAGTMKAGVHTLTITSVDALGNVSVTVVRIVVHATIAGLLTKFNDGLSTGKVQQSQKNGLLYLITSAQTALAKNDHVTAKSFLNQLDSSIKATRGNKIDAAWADLYLNWLEDLIARL